MKYFQMMPMQPQKETRRYHVTDLIFFFGIFIFFISCKALKYNKDDYEVINTVLDTYAAKDSIYLHPKVVVLNHKIIEEFKTYGIDSDSCNTKINEIISSPFEILSEEKKTEEKWKYSKITNPKIITDLELKQPASVEKYKKLAETIKDEYDVLDRKFMLWSIEHNKSMLRLSCPFFNTDKSYALVYVSKYNDGQFVLTLKKEAKQKWKVICKKRLSHY